MPADDVCLIPPNDEHIKIQFRSVIHLVNGFQNPYGGSEQETLHLARMLNTKGEVKLWSSSSRSSPELIEQYGIKPLGFTPRQRPNGGTYVFVGSHWRNRIWPYLGPVPQRLIYVFNTFHPKLLKLTSTHPTLLCWPKTEYVFISDFRCPPVLCAHPLVASLCVSTEHLAPAAGSACTASRCPPPNFILRRPDAFKKERTTSSR
jgi:hypothetical protein